MVEFRPDGRYVLESVWPGKPRSVEGGFEAGPSTLLVKPEGEEPILYEMSVAEGRLTLAGGDLNGGSATLGRNDPGLPAGAALLGRWVARPQVFGVTLKHVLTIYPDGRYRIEYHVNDDVTPAEGTYSFDGKQITADGIKFATEVRGDRMTLTGGAFTEAATFAREAGSIERVIEDAEKARKAKEKDDAGWRAKIPLGPRAEAAPGERVFDGATVFARQQIHSYMSVIGYVCRRGEGPMGTHRTSVQWSFRPDGRVRYQGVVYSGVGRIDDITHVTAGDPTRADVSGRYRIEHGYKVIVEMDNGEKAVLVPTDGRLNVSDGRFAYHQHDWFQKILKGN